MLCGSAPGMRVCEEGTCARQASGMPRAAYGWARAPTGCPAGWAAPGTATCAGAGAALRRTVRDAASGRLVGPRPTVATGTTKIERYCRTPDMRHQVKSKGRGTSNRLGVHDCKGGRAGPAAGPGFFAADVVGTISSSPRFLL